MKEFLDQHHESFILSSDIFYDIIFSLGRTNIQSKKLCDSLFEIEYFYNMKKYQISVVHNWFSYSELLQNWKIKLDIDCPSKYIYIKPLSKSYISLRNKINQNNLAPLDYVKDYIKKYNSNELRNKAY